MIDPRRDEAEEIARAARPDLDVVVRAHSEPEMERLESMGVGLAVMGERELAVRMLSYACASLGVAETPRPGTAAPLPAELR